MPRDAQDVEAARTLVALGYPTLQPVCRDMLRRIKDHKSPVADVFCDFFAGVGEPVAAEINEILLWSKLPNLKYKLVANVVARWPREAISKVTHSLQMLVSHTDFFETDLLCIQLLDKYQLSERDWLKQWLDFKRKRIEKYRAFAVELEKQLA